VASNKRALSLGRVAAVRQDLLMQSTNEANVRAQSLEEIVDKRVKFLMEYQDESYARSYSDFIDVVFTKERVLGEGEEFSKTVARNLFKLMAYKDEYEVARLHLDPAFHARITDQFEGQPKLSFNLAPPVLTGRTPIKREFGSWILLVFGVLKAMRKVRGTVWDVFGYTSERRMERRLVAEYRTLIVDLCRSLSAETYQGAIGVAAAAARIRGYGHVKLASVDAYRLT
jgi:indolepyruvate ferredoxin oxidoreductase